MSALRWAPARRSRGAPCGTLSGPGSDRAESSSTFAESGYCGCHRPGCPAAPDIARPTTLLTVAQNGRARVVRVGEAADRRSADRAVRRG
ncbi:MAG: hypothetical protein U5R48_15265 [Gammaproteobacteria bacterium]|nr:hypothetical protein [Gammaproteobacteria bacterium]